MSVEGNSPLNFTVYCTDVKLIVSCPIADVQDVTPIWRVTWVFVVGHFSILLFCRREAKHVCAVSIDGKDIEVRAIKPSKNQSLAVG